VLDSEKTTSAAELEGGGANQEAEGVDEEDFSDLEDLAPGGEKAQAATAAPTEGDSSYNDIENFNEGLIEGELAKEGTGDQATVETDEIPPILEGANAPAASAAETQEFDLENADVDSQTTAASGGGGASGATNKITNLEYKSFESGGTVVISAEQPVTYKVREESEFNQTVIEISDVQLPEKFKLPYIAKDFGQPVATINAYQDPGSGSARIVIQYKSSVKPSVEQKGNSLLVMNNGAAGSPDASLANGDENPSPLLVTDEMAVNSQPAPGPVDAGGPAAMEAAPSGKRISLEMDEVEIREVIKIIADEVNINVIIDANVTGNTSVHIKGVPWEQALSSILKSHALGYVRQGNIMRISLEETLTKEASSYADRLTKEEQARKTLEPRKVRIFSVNYADVDLLATQMLPLLSLATGGGPAGKAVGDKRPNAVVVTDYEENINRIEQVIRSLDIPPLQILLEGKIVEANETFTRDFGLRWTANSTFNITGKQADLRTITSSAPNSGAAGGLFSTMNVGTFDILGDLTAILGLFEQEQKVKVLSSPKIVAMNKEKAVISQTTDFPIRTTVVNNGTTSTSVTFNPATLSLEVTPQVTFNGDTILDVRVQRDVPGAIVETSRGINKRTASAKVMVKDGQTLVLGGIYNIDEQNTETGVPWLKDIPVLGYLFKSTTKSVTKNELVIFLTPKIINPEVIKQLAALNRKADISNPEPDVPMAEAPAPPPVGAPLPVPESSSEDVQDL
jgi:type IV pilus assembly protein PilQ